MLFFKTGKVPYEVLIRNVFCYTGMKDPSVILGSSVGEDAALLAVLAIGRVSLSEEEIMQCANIVLALLPFERLEIAGITRKPLRSLARDRVLVGKIMRLSR